ncbi:sacsin isoform X2 [Lampetra fluviatilis]
MDSSAENLSAASASSWCFPESGGCSLLPGMPSSEHRPTPPIATQPGKAPDTGCLQARLSGDAGPVGDTGPAGGQLAPSSVCAACSLPAMLTRRPQDTQPRLEVTILHEYLGPRVYQVDAWCTAKDIKELIFKDTGYPTAEQRLFFETKEVPDFVAVSTVAKDRTPTLTLQGRGLLGAGRFGQSTPPLVDFLKDILRRYPDGGQILKELIQNSEDAGATEVRFLFDEKSFGTDSLHSSEFAAFQGPALYVFNDAVFTDDDWRGIQETARSRKKDDPLKVGRFGIGFNSVYHITDFPSILSGAQLGMLDPHERLFGPHESGMSWHLKSDQKEIAKFPDHVSPYCDIFGCSLATFNAGYFKGTIFRFPLRTAPSLLSSTIYTKEKVLELFNSFQADADTVLLFLKNVQMISVHLRTADGNEKALFKVKATESPESRRWRLQGLNAAFGQYLHKRQTRAVTSLSYPLVIGVEESTPSGVRLSETSWLVASSIAGRGLSKELDSLSDDLKYLPMVEMAVLTAGGSESDEGAVAAFVGRTFCFLPLPPGEESKTGLPVHVNGYFGLTDNRRSIRWREIDQYRDPAAWWNDLLVKNVVPKAYATLILEAIKKAQEQGKAKPIDPDKVYNVWPDVEKMQVHWKPILEPFFSELFQKPVVLSMSGKWIKITDGVFFESGQKGDSMQAVLGYLNRAGVPVVVAPANICRVIKKYSPDAPIRTVSAALLRHTLRTSRVTVSDDDRLPLLGYVLSDGNYSDLHSLTLVPLQDGSFASFIPSRNDELPIYIPSEEHPRKLFYGMDARFISDNLSELTRQALIKLAESSKQGELVSRLRTMTSDNAVTLLTDIMGRMFPGKDLSVTWCPGDSTKKHPPHVWLTDLWRYLYHKFALDLNAFENLPLIPHKPIRAEDSSVTLFRLVKNSVLVLREEKEVRLPELVAETVEQVGGVVIAELDPCLHHPLLKDYLLSPLPAMILHVFARVGVEQACRVLETTTPDKKIALRQFLAGLMHVTEQEHHVLVRLPIFKKLSLAEANDSECFTKLDGAKVLHHSARLPGSVPLSQSLVDCCDEATMRITSMVHVPQLTTTQCLGFMFQDIESGFYGLPQATDIMIWVLSSLAYLRAEKPAVIGEIASLHFLSGPSGVLLRPCDLFDPELESLKMLLVGQEELFPSTHFSSPDILHALRQVGLKGEEHLSEGDLIQVARKVEELWGKGSLDYATLLKKTQNLMYILKKRNLKNIMNSDEAEKALKMLKWIPALRSRPNNYPASLCWKGEAECFYSPNDVCVSHHASVVGSSLPVVEVECERVGEFLGFYREPSVNHVTEHLKTVVDWYSSTSFSEGEGYLFQHMLLEVYKYMQKHLQTDGDVFLRLDFPWVWTNTCFCIPTEVSLSRAQELDLKPYCYTLPKSLGNFKDLFTFCGCLLEVTPVQIVDVLKKIKETSEKPNVTHIAKTDLQLALNIIRWLHQNHIHVSEDIPIPIQQTYNDALETLCMKEIHGCTYCDIKVEDLQELLDDSSEPIYLAHEDISMKTAEWLNIPCLSTRLIDPENLGFEQSGQQEPLTVRIQNILQEYPTVSDTFKELTQNADDAGATECSFLVDLRKNLDIKDNLLDSGMAVCHGPALWAFNNAIFTDEDFTNITKLGHSLKNEQIEKVGKFGLGFNSVYHITDIPIFMSRQYMVMFDPNITHLGKHIRDKSNPGIKVNWVKQHKRLQKFPNQFKPFVNVFNCELPLLRSAPYEYQGTLFRLSFRTEQEAATSQISNTYYSLTDALSFIDEFRNSSYRLIIFTQNVTTMRLKFIKGESEDPKQARDVVLLNKKVCASKVGSCTHNILLESAKVMKVILSAKQQAFPLPKCSSIISINIEESEMPDGQIADVQHRVAANENASYFEITSQTGERANGVVAAQTSVKRTHWLLHSCFVDGEALDFCLKEEGKKLGLLPCGGIAVPLEATVDGCWKIQQNASPLGEVFCYLPIKIKTGLPVHVNGCFAVSSNRKEIWKLDLKGQWNTLFMRSVIVMAYINTLNILRRMSIEGELIDYIYHAIWPDPGTVHNDFSAICSGFYQALVCGKLSSSEVFSDGNSWFPLCNARFLDNRLLQKQVVGQAAFKVFAKYLQNSQTEPVHAVMLPSWVEAAFEKADCLQAIAMRTFTENKFFKEIFIPNMKEIHQDLRDPLVLHVLDELLDTFKEVLSKIPCIPCTAKDLCLAIPSQLVHPQGKASRLFDEDDGRFPSGTTADYLEPSRLLKLESLGMVKDHVSWPDLMERAQSVQGLTAQCPVKARQRASILLTLMGEALQRGDGVDCETIQKLRETAFIPCLVKPDVVGLSWKGSEFSPNTLFSPNQLYSIEQQNLVCLLHPIVDESIEKGCGSISAAVKELLGLQKKPSVQTVIAQLKAATKIQVNITSDHEDICYSCYRFLNESLAAQENTKSLVIEELRQHNITLVDNCFVSPSKVAFNLDFSACPYLFQLPTKLRKEYSELFKIIGVKDEFLVSDFTSVLDDLKKKYGQKSLEEEDFHLCRRIVTEGIWSLVKEQDQSVCAHTCSHMFLPDTNRQLIPVDNLCYNDCPWITVKDSAVKYCHQEIPREIAVRLGAVPKRHKALEKYASSVDFSNLGSEFGQKEKLTSRIKSILNAYPSEKEMLKELLQNADDAKASEIHFIWDPREHSKDRIFDEKWGSLQGAALCVYNNQPFTEDDIKGIQHIGKGTKGGNPSKTGQYGIGFNSVYHITDCPMLLSNNDTLCIFDPHARFAPGASSISPGRMFRNIDEDFKAQFSDVLNPFLGDTFPHENATMFRFPIRNFDMARKSEINQTPTSDRMVHNLLDKIRADGAELLLFLNHIEKISICEIDKVTGATASLYSVEVKLTEEERKKRKQFYASIHDAIGRRRQLSQISVQVVTYLMDIADSDGNATSWMICNRIGFSDVDKLSQDLLAAHRNEDISLLPRGGVAACISHNYKKPHRAFCFLPLSLETGLPVHVNGHFALDSSRRNLWRDDNGIGVRSYWNSALMTKLISPAYVELLLQLREHYFKSNASSITVLASISHHNLQDLVQKYLYFFPLSKVAIQPDWHRLLTSVYRAIHVDTKPLLPVVRECKSESARQGTETHTTYTITWTSTSSPMKDKPFFDNLLQDELQAARNIEYNLTIRKAIAENVFKLKELLLEIGFNLVFMSDESSCVYHCFREGGVPVHFVTPKDVRGFLLTFSTKDTICQIGKLPCQLSQSKINSFQNLKILVDYCLKDAEENDIILEGLPLLVTLDDVLQVFDGRKPRFLSSYHELVPSRKDIFMHTMYSKYQDRLLNSGVAKTFDIDSFAELLPAVLAREYRSRSPVKWKETFASEAWLRRCWQFIASLVSKDADTADGNTVFDKAIATLKEWTLLPAATFTISSVGTLVQKDNILVPLNLIHAVIFPHSHNDRLFSALMKAGSLQLMLPKIASHDNHLTLIFSKYTANIENPSSILNLLSYMLKTSGFQNNLEEHDHETLLMYFNRNIKKVTNPDDLQVLRMLPCYKTIDGNFVNLHKYRSCYVLTKTIPSAEMDVWTKSTAAIFIQDNPQLQELFTYLGFTQVDDLDVYVKYILPKFDSLTFKAKLRHVIYLKKRIKSLEENKALQEKICSKLEGLAFIPDTDGRLRPAKHFFDKKTKIYDVMLPERSFIPDEFFITLEELESPTNQQVYQLSWHKFLKQIGLKHELSQQQLIFFSRDISNRSQTEQWSFEKLKKTVDTFLDHIFTERDDLFNGSFLRDLSIIAFMYPERAPSDLLKLHPQFQETKGTLPLIRFSHSQVNPKMKGLDSMQLLWSASPLLPEKACPTSIREQKQCNAEKGPKQLEELFTTLNVSLFPPLEKVIVHCKNICSVAPVDEFTLRTRAAVLKSIYGFLNSQKVDFRHQLRGVPLVLVDEGRKLVKPDEVVINLENEADFKPYLHKLPLELGAFHHHFKCLGTEDNVSVRQYVDVLSRIFVKSNGKHLEPNEMRTVKRVVSGLFKNLQTDSVRIRTELENIRDLMLFLPSADGKLVKSGSLVFDDAPHYKSRIYGSNMGVPLLVDLGQCYLGKDHSVHTKIVMLLPLKLRPRLLSSILEEHLDEDDPKPCHYGKLCSLQGRLQLLLSSEQFTAGLVRVMKHESENAFLANEERALMLCKALNVSLRVSCFEKLQTTLRLKENEMIPKSKCETLAFLKKTSTSSIHLYVQHSDFKDINFLLALAMTIKSSADNLISDTSYLIAMLGCIDIYRIADKLDSLGVKYDITTEPSKMELPLPGTPIPREIHHLLLMDPTNVFYPGEYVGYLVDPEGKESSFSYQATYTYAVIIQEVDVSQEDDSLLTKSYQIDIGYNEYKVVNSLDLYKFLRHGEGMQDREESMFKEKLGSHRRMPDDTKPEGTKRHSPKAQVPDTEKPISIADVLSDITLVLEQAWKGPEAERKKVIRRLYLKWHPDKNADHLEIANEVFKHLQTEIRRLETGAMESNKDKSQRRPFGSARFYADSFSFEKFFKSWNQEATSHSQEKQGYREKFSASAQSGSQSDRAFVPPTSKVAGNPVEALRWIRQARANLSAARNDLHRNANEWLCFKCYQAVKLALIAVEYCVRGHADKDVHLQHLAQKAEEQNTLLLGLANDVLTLEMFGIDGLKTQYPDVLPFPQVPNDRFPTDVSLKVIEITGRIIIRIENFIRQKI